MLHNNAALVEEFATQPTKELNEITAIEAMIWIIEMILAGEDQVVVKKTCWWI